MSKGTSCCLVSGLALFAAFGIAVFGLIAVIYLIALIAILIV